MGREHREFKRVPTLLRCWCEGHDVTVYARVVNLSEGGLFLRTNTPMERGTRAQLRLAAEPAEVAAEATVIWTRQDDREGPPGMGLRFDGLNAQAREQLRLLIQAELAAGASLGVEP